MSARGHIVMYGYQDVINCGGGSMLLRQVLRDAAAIGAVILMLAAAAAAQGVTGTITGTVKDAQGGVIPGATVTLISATRGTASAPVVTNAAGDFVFPNVTAGAYTIQVELSSFSTLRRSGVEVSPGSIVALGALTIQVGATSEVVTVIAETPLVQAASGERSFTVSPQSVSNLPLNNRTFDSLLSLAPGVVVTPARWIPPLARAAVAGPTTCWMARPRWTRASIVRRRGSASNRWRK